VIRCKDKTYLFFGPGVIFRRSYRTGGFIPKSDIDRGIKTWVLLKYRLTIVTTNVVTSNPAHGCIHVALLYVTSCQGIVLVVYFDQSNTTNLRVYIF
jgi:hypothetical protein